MKLAFSAANNSAAEAADSRSDWCYLGLILAGILSIYFFGLGSFGLIDRADAYYSEGAREMLECEQYLIPQLNYQLFFDKPILIYWLQVFAYKVLGVSAFAARSVSCVSAAILVFLTYLFGRTTKGKKVGFCAAAVLLCTPMYIGLGRTALVDMTFTALLSVALYLMYLKLSGSARVFGLLAYALLGLAVLTKGPLAIALAVAVIGAFLLSTCRSRGQWFEAIRRLDPIVGSFVLCSVMMPWYVVAGIETRGLWTDVFLLKGNLARFGGKVGHVNSNCLFYLPVLTYAICPWFVFLPAGFRFASTKGAEESGADQSNRLRIFLWCWLLALFTIFSCAGSKLHTYLLPLTPAVSLIVAVTFNDWCDRWNKQTEIAQYLKVSSALFAALGFALVVFSIVTFSGFCDPLLFSYLPEVLGEKLEWIASTASSTTKFFIVTALAGFGAGLLYQNWLLTKGKVEGSLGMLLASMAWMCVFASQIGFDLGHKFVGGDLHRVMEVLKGKQDGAIAIIDDFKPSLMFYLERPIESVLTPNQLSKGDPVSKLYFIVKQESFDRFFGKSSQFELKVIANSGRWLVGETQGVKIVGLPALAELVMKDGVQEMNPELVLLPFHAGEKPQSGKTSR